MINIIKPGTVISLTAAKFMFRQPNKQSYFAILPINAKLIVLSEITDGGYFNTDGGYFNWECFLKVFYENKIGYISWASDTYIHL